MKSGDNLTKIAAQHGTSVKALRAANGLKTDSIKVGQKLKIPAKAASAPVTAPATPAEPVPSQPDRLRRRPRRPDSKRLSRTPGVHPGVRRSSSQMKVAVTILVSCVAALLALGMVMLYSSSMAQVGARLSDDAIGLVRARLAWPDGRRPCGLPPVEEVLVAAVRTGGGDAGAGVEPHLGVRRNGAARGAGSVRQDLAFQPSEFAKLALIIALAWYGERFPAADAALWKRGMLIPGLLIGLTAGLIFKEPDVGNALVLATVSGSAAADCGHSPEVFPAAGYRRCDR